MAKKKKPRYDRRKVVRELARERVGTVPASRVIEPPTRRKRAKHGKKQLAEEAGECSV